MKAADPRNTKKRMKVHCNSEIRQSQVLLTARASRPISSGHLIEVVMPIAFESGSQKTEKPYAIPMQRWIARADGGISQRLKPGPAIVRSRAKKPGVLSTPV